MFCIVISVSFKTNTKYGYKSTHLTPELDPIQVCMTCGCDGHAWRIFLQVVVFEIFTGVILALFETDWGRQIMGSKPVFVSLINLQVSMTKIKMMNWETIDLVA